MRNIAYLLLIVGLAGCARHYPIASPDKSERYLVHANSSINIVNHANEICPQGYDFIDAPEMKQGTMEAIIKCKTN